MKNATFQLSVFLESVSSSAMENTTFYTVILRAGGKQKELPQKKSLTGSNLISFLQNLAIKLNQGEVQHSKNQAKLQVYSVQKYGKKKLLGQSKFGFQLTNRRQIKAQFSLGSDQKSQIRFTYGFFKIESRVLSQKQSTSSKPQSLKDAKKELQLRLIDQFDQKQAKEVNNFQKQIVSQIQTQHSNELCKVTINSQNLGTQKHQQIQDLYLISFGQSFAQLNKKMESLNLYKAESLNTTNQQLAQSRLILKIQSKVVQFSTLSQPSALTKSIHEVKELLNSSIYSSTDLAPNLPLGTFSSSFNPLSMTQAKPKPGKLALIKPRTKVESYEQWENDDNLVNIIHQMADQVKGNLGYIKLSKLTKLTKKITDTRNSNKLLTIANNQLIQNQQIMNKKLEVFQQIIKEKEEKYFKELNFLRSQLKQIEKKLMDKYTEDMFLQQKLKQAHSKIQNHQKQVKQLEKQIQVKKNQVHHLRQVLSSYDEKQQTPGIQVKTVEFKKQSQQKQHKFKRNGSNSFFKADRNDKSFFNKNNKLLTEKDTSYIDLNCQILPQNEDEIKGISPNFVEFFTSFRMKSNDNNKMNEYHSVGPVKKSRIYHNKQKQQQSSEKQPSISKMFIEI